MATDGEQFRAASREIWDAAAPGWRRRSAQMRAVSAPVSQWMVDAIHPQPGHRVLDLAAGMGETGFLAAELIAPGGILICSDQSEVMLEGARARAAELGLENVEFKPIDAEWIDLPLADVDAVLCRWGLMLMADPGAAMRECRRVLKPGGRFALAVWTQRERNPWVTAIAEAIAEVAEVPPVDPAAPGMFALGDPARLEGMLEEAGFAEIEIEPLDFDFRYDDAEHYLDIQLDLSSQTAKIFGTLDDQQVSILERRVAETLAPFATEDGSIVIPARTLVAAATA
jgi:ubiquinone/menaquinone biosynthesis C-methylase UbiE